MLMVNVLAMAGGLLMGLCKMWKPHIMVISGRAVMGFYCGKGGETTPDKWCLCVFKHSEEHYTNTI